MKTLQESLFDKDIVQKSDIRLGELYEISPIRGYCTVTNNIHEVLGMFDEKALTHAKFPLHVREDCSFIEYWSELEPKKLVPFINVIFNLPMTVINKLIDEPINGERKKQFITYLEKYFYNNGAKAKNIYIAGRKMSGDKFVEITIYDNIMLSRPSSINLVFEKR